MVLLTAIDTEDFGQYIGVAETMRAEARAEAERNLDARIARISQIGQIRTGDSDPRGQPGRGNRCSPPKTPASVFWCWRRGSATRGRGSDHPFVAYNRLHILVTIVPGAMSDEEIVAVA